MASEVFSLVMASEVFHAMGGLLRLDTSLKASAISACTAIN
jgi:hypothetical protein